MKTSKSGQNQKTNNNGVDVIDLTGEEFELLQERIRKKELTNNDYSLLGSILKGYLLVNELLNDSKTSIKRLKRLFFQKSEKSKDILKEKMTEDTNNQTGNLTTGTEDTEEEISEDKKKNKPEKEKRKGHGRIGADDYTGAERIFVKVEGLKSREICPDCHRGRLYSTKACKEVRIGGSSPIKGKIFELEGLRCCACQKLFRAELPKNAGKNKYDEEASSILATMKYGYGMPFNRLEWIQKNLGIPFQAEPNGP
jgi:transposase